MESDDTNSSQDGGGTQVADNVVRFPRDWLGPRDELIPFGPRVRAEALNGHTDAASPREPGAPSARDTAAPSAHDFWGAAAQGDWEFDPVLPDSPTRPIPEFFSRAGARVGEHGRIAVAVLLVTIGLAGIGLDLGASSGPAARRAPSTAHAATVLHPGDSLMAHDGGLSRLSGARRTASARRGRSTAARHPRHTVRASARHQFAGATTGSTGTTITSSPTTASSQATSTPAPTTSDNPGASAASSSQPAATGASGALGPGSSPDS